MAAGCQGDSRGGSSSPALPAEPSRALTTGVDSTVLQWACVCPDAQLPRVLRDKRPQHGAGTISRPTWSPRSAHRGVPSAPGGVPTVLTWRRTVPSAKKSGLRVSTTMRSK